jgi:hypothetical protein
MILSMALLMIFENGRVFSRDFWAFSGIISSQNTFQNTPLEKLRRGNILTN